MTAALRALPTVFSIGLQRQLAYRWNYLLRALFSAVPLLVSWVFWEAVFQGKETVGRYTLAGLLTYYAVLLIVEAVSSPADDDFQISREIREGMLNPILLRPLPYGLYRGALFLSGRCAYLVAAFIPVLLCFFILSRVVHLELASFDILHGLPALFGSALLQFSLTLCLSLTSFWFLDISSLIFLVYSLEFLAGGHVFPLDLLPAPLFTAARFLPFAYEYWFPAAALCGTLSHREWQIGIGMQFAWAIFFLFLAHLLWKAGLRKYTAAGG
jgi:ABC-2 type transport system permease protein